MVTFFVGIALVLGVLALTLIALTFSSLFNKQERDRRRRERFYRRGSMY